MSRVLLVIPPFTQLSSPYPATSFLSGILNNYGIDNRQIDLGLKTALNFFSRSGIERLFYQIEKEKLKKNGKVIKFISQKKSYINTIEEVIKFLQGSNDTLAQRLVRRDFLPENSRFAILKDIDIKKLGLMESARFIATLYLDDIVDLARNTILPNFNLSSYYEKLAITAHRFDKIYDQINIKKDMIWDISENILTKENFSDINLVCVTVPFPGNLYSALKIGKWIKENYPNIKVAIGGGYPNTELRSLKEKRIFEFVDYVCLDDGESPILSIVDFINGKITSKNLSRTFILEDGEVKLIDAPQEKYASRQTSFIPNYKDLPLSEYFTLYETTNKMHRLWSTKIFLKLQVAYGCYHAKCSFCDTSLDYIKNYKGNKPELIIKQIKSVVEDTGFKAFHFVDEAMPPHIAKEIAIELIRQNINIVWWGNIRFDKAYTKDLCRLLAASGCIAVTGGLETANERILKLMDKRINLREGIKVLNNFAQVGIMIHTYLIYGFPGETIEDAVNSLEIIRQLFKNNIIHSAYYHRFSLTVHSRIFKDPIKFNIKVDKTIYEFANNDCEYEDMNDTNIDSIGEDLNKALYNFNYNNLVSKDIGSWFGGKKITVNIDGNFVKKIVEDEDRNYSGFLAWIGNAPYINDNILIIPKFDEDFEYDLPEALAVWIIDFIEKIDIRRNPKLNKIRISDIEKSFPTNIEPFEDFLKNELWVELIESGLIFI